MNIINNNPYRQLGIYTTSSQREVVSNQGKMKAFLKVGRKVTFALDLNGILPVISRTEESVADAASKLSLPVEKLRFAQFWFAKCTQIDEIACAKLTNSDIDGAIEIWNKKENASSLQNLLMCAIIKEEIRKAISYAEKLYSSHGEEFVKMILGDNALATSANLAYDFLDALCSEYKPSLLLGSTSISAWKEYISNKSIKPLTDKITTAIDNCKSTKGKGVSARYNAGTKLMNDTKADLAQFKKIVSTNDLQYQMLADKLGLEILQCGIDYYNASEAQNAAQKAMILQKYALSIVVGKMAKDRCKENVDILTKIIAELPPSAVFSEDKAIKEELRKFCNLPDKICHAVTLLNNTKPHLQTIKNKLGSSNSYYLKISTLVVSNALHNLIEEVNRVQNAVVSIINDNSTSVSPAIRAIALKTAMSQTFEEAWAATKIMDSFDMESDFKINRYNTQRASLKGICEQIGVSTSSYGRTTSNSSSTTSRPSSTPSSSSDTDHGCLIGLICIGGGLGIGAAIGGVVGAVVGAIIGLMIYGQIGD
jgi:hypothetical protein